MYGSLLSPLPGIFLGMRRLRIMDKAMGLILIVMTVSFLSDIVMLLLAKFGHRNLPVAHVYGFAEGVILTQFFRIQIPKYNSFLAWVTLIFIVFYTMDSFFIEGIFKFNAFARSLEALLMIILSIIFFYFVYTEEHDIFIDKSPSFLSIVGILFYFSGAFFSFLLATDILSQSPSRFYGSWNLHNFCNLLKNIIFAIALWRVKPNLTASSF
jgi:hypothetical protein